MTTCSVDDCPKPARTRGWCSMHYERWRLHGSLELPERTLAKDLPCTVTDCTRKRQGSLYCSSHYMRWWRYGDPLAGNRERISGTIEERLLAGREIDRDTGCWIWRFGRHPFGYGVIRVEGESRTTHTVSYEVFMGERNGLMVLHRCDNPPCFKPGHLYLGTAQDNSDDMVVRNRPRGRKRTTSEPTSV
jgi:hypothetical protein